MTSILVTVFAVTSKAGQELARALKTTLETMKINNCPISVEVIWDGDQEDLMQAGLRDDIVIFDASIEDATGSNYKAANMWPCIMAHFLVVSRTRLPLNFQTLRDGGTPDTSGEITNRPYSLTNEYLIQWVQDQVQKLAPHLPRPVSERLDIPHGRFSQYSEEIKQISRQLFQVSDDIFEAERQSNSRAFVSYLSRYSRHHPFPQQSEGFHVEELIEQIQISHRERPFPVLYYPPGALSSEFMTEHRRWQVVSIIDRRIRSVDEFYIFETPDYYNSWWTLAELATLAYIRSDDATKLPKVYRCQPQRKGLIPIEATPDFVQKLTDQLARQFGRFLSNSDPFTMGLETIKGMQKVRKLPKFLQWLQFKAIQGLSDKMLTEFIASTDEEQHQMQEESDTFNFDRYREMVYSHVFDDSFWEDRIVTCPICSRENTNSSDFDFNTFLSSKQQGQYRVSQNDLSIILQQLYWKCPKHAVKFRVVEDKDHSQYQWWPVRVGKPTGPEGRYIEKIPVYILE
jgi:hypothetical protein